jgi:hypothetical protein
MADGTTDVVGLMLAIIARDLRVPEVAGGRVVSILITVVLSASLWSRRPSVSPASTLS